jgi:hypothetical protein
MDFRSELAKWGYNKGNSIDVEILINEILPEILSQQKRMYSEQDMREAVDFMPYHLEYGNIVARKSDKDIENFIEKFKKK